MPRVACRKCSKTFARSDALRAHAIEDHGYVPSRDGAWMIYDEESDRYTDKVSISKKTTSSKKRNTDEKKASHSKKKRNKIDKASDSKKKRHKDKKSSHSTKRRNKENVNTSTSNATNQSNNFATSSPLPFCIDGTLQTGISPLSPRDGLSPSDFDCVDIGSPSSSELQLDESQHAITYSLNYPTEQERGCNAGDDFFAPLVNHIASNLGYGLDASCDLQNGYALVQPWATADVHQCRGGSSSHHAQSTIATIGVPMSELLPSDVCDQQPTASYVEQPRLIHSPQPLHLLTGANGSDEKELAVICRMKCSGTGCSTTGTAEWRFCCLTCARSTPPINFDLCAQCFHKHTMFVTPIGVSTDRSSLVALHDRTHEFTLLYNLGRSHGQGDVSEPLSPLFQCDYVPPCDAPSALCKLPVQLLNSVGSLINDLAAAHSPTEWKDLQSRRVSSSVDLHLFDSRFGEHGFLTLLFWCRSNMFSDDCQLALSFIRCTNFTELGNLIGQSESNPLAQFLLYHLGHCIKLRTDMSIKVQKFDFSFVEKIVRAVGRVREFFQHEDFTPIYLALVDHRQPSLPYLQQLNAYTMKVIDKQQSNFYQVLTTAITKAGLPKTANSDELMDPQNPTGVIRYLKELWQIMFEYRRIRIWRSCRLRMADFCWELMSEIVPQSSTSSSNVSALSHFSGLTENEKQLFLFLKESHEKLRPRMPSFVFEHDESFLCDVVDEGYGCGARLLQLFLALVKAKRQGTAASSSMSATMLSMPPSTSCSTPRFVSLLRQLLTLFIYVARERQQHSREMDFVVDQMSAKMSDEELQSLGSVITVSQKWCPRGSSNFDLMYVLDSSVQVRAIFVDISIYQAFNPIVHPPLYPHIPITSDRAHKRRRLVDEKVNQDHQVPHR